MSLVRILFVSIWLWKGLELYELSMNQLDKVTETLLNFIFLDAQRSLDEVSVLHKTGTEKHGPSIKSMQGENLLLDFMVAIKDTIDELKTKRSHRNLEDFLHTNFIQIKYTAIECDSNQKTIDKLKTKLNCLNEESDNLLLELPKKMAENDIAINESMLKCDMQINLIRNWENARQNQKLEKCNEFSDSTERNIIFLDNELKMSQFSNEKIHLFFIRKKEFLTNEIRKWRNCLASESIKLANELDQAKMDHLRLSSDIKRIQKEFNDRQCIIDAYSARQTRKLQREKHLETAKKKVVIIQAWWRGVMCRNQIRRSKRVKKPSKKKPSRRR